MIDIETYFDPVCPWCYLGKARLDLAIEAHGDAPVRLAWSPYLLNPDIPEDGVDRTAYLHWKFGGEQGARSAYTPIVDAAQELGLEFNPSLITRTPNSIDAHRLLIWAEIEGADVGQVIDALFREYFVRGRDIGRNSVLVEIAVDCGMDGDVVGCLLGGNQDRNAVTARNAAARRRGIDAVPCFVVNRSVVVHGAQPPGVWESVFRQMAIGGDVRAG